MRYRVYDANGCRAEDKPRGVLQDPRVPDSTDLGRAFQDQVRNEFREQGARNVCRNIVDQLRGDARDEVIGRVCQTVLITHAVLHDARRSGGLSERAILPAAGAARGMRRCGGKAVYLSGRWQALAGGDSHAMRGVSGKGILPQRNGW